jgi:hypothetical protein
VFLFHFLFSKEPFMPLLEIHANDIPDKELPPSGGVRRMTINGVPKLEPKLDKMTKAQTGMNLVIALKIKDDPQMKPLAEDVGRFVFDRIDVTDPRGHIRLKRLAKSCGLPFDSEGNFNSDDLAERTCVAKIINKPVTNPLTGEVTIFANVDMQNGYMLPGDPGFPA